jgi:hypothetical protein
MAAQWPTGGKPDAPEPPPPTDADAPPDDGGPPPANVVRHARRPQRWRPFIDRREWADDDGDTHTAYKVPGTQPELWVEADRSRIYKASNSGKLSVAYGWCPQVVAHAHTPEGRKGQRHRLTLRVGAAEIEASEADLEDGSAWTRLGVPVAGSRNYDQLHTLTLVLAEAHDGWYGRTIGYPHTGWHEHTEHGWFYLWPDGRTTPEGVRAVFTGAHRDQTDRLVADAAPPADHPADDELVRWAVHSAGELLPGAAHGLAVIGLAARSFATTLHPMPCTAVIEGEAGVGKTSLAGAGRALAVSRTAPAMPNVTFRARSASATTNSIQPAIDREGDLPVVGDDVLAADEGRATPDQLRAGQTLLDQLAGAAEEHGPIRIRLNRDATAQIPYRARGGMTLTVQSLPPQLDRSVLRRLLLLSVPADGELHERVKAHHPERERGLRSLGERIVADLAGQLVDHGADALAASLAEQHEDAYTRLADMWREQCSGELPSLLDLPASIAAEALVGLRLIERAAGIDGLADRLASRLPAVLAAQLNRMSGRDADGRSPIERLLDALGERLAAGDSGAAHRAPPRIVGYGNPGECPPELHWPDNGEPVPPAVLGWHPDPRDMPEYRQAVTVAWADSDADRLYLPPKGRRELVAVADELARHDADMPTGEAAIADALDRHEWLWDRDGRNRGPKRMHCEQRDRVWSLRLSDVLTVFAGGEPDAGGGPTVTRPDGPPNGRPDAAIVNRLVWLAHIHPEWAAVQADASHTTPGPDAWPYQCIACGAATDAPEWCTGHWPSDDPPWLRHTCAAAHHYPGWAAHIASDREGPPDPADCPPGCLVCGRPGEPDAYGHPWCVDHCTDGSGGPPPPERTTDGNGGGSASHTHEPAGGPVNSSHEPAGGPENCSHEPAGGPENCSHEPAGGPANRPATSSHEPAGGPVDGPAEELASMLAARIDPTVIESIERDELESLAGRATADGRDLAALADAARGSLDTASDPAAVVVHRLRRELDADPTPRLAALDSTGITFADGTHHPIEPPAHAGELYDAARACGLATDGRGDTVYVHSDALAVMGLPGELPPGTDWQHPQPHPWVDGWADDDASVEPAGLTAALTLLRRGVYGRLSVVLVAYDARAPEWANAADGGELATVAARFADAVGEPYRPAPSTTGLRVLRRVSGQLDPPGQPPDAVRECPRATIAWARPPTDTEASDTRRPVVAVDRNAAYLTAVSGLDLPMGEHGWTHHEWPEFDKRQPGYWHCWLDPPEAGPDPFRGGGKAWWPTPLVALAVEWGQQPTVSEAWTAPRKRALDGWYQRIRNARAELSGSDGDWLALAAVKRCYTAALGSLGGGFRDPDKDPTARREWQQHVHASHAARVARDCERVRAAGGPEPLAVTDTDTVWWIGEHGEGGEQTVARLGLAVGVGLGEWKIKAVATVGRLLDHLDVAGPQTTTGEQPRAGPDAPEASADGGELVDAALAAVGGDMAALAAAVDRGQATVRRWSDRTARPDGESCRRLAGVIADSESGPSGVGQRDVLDAVGRLAKEADRG